ncbi:hypothetical protein ES705_24693 [subsurface metagenome]
MPGKIEAVHHTLADWDFQFGATYRSLSADTFISAPTSLKYSNCPVGWGNEVLCRIPATLNLPQGEMRGWFQTTKNHITTAVFRDQSPLGTAPFQNCYYVLVYLGEARLTRLINGVGPPVDTTPCYLAFNEWIHYRTVWYNGMTPGEEEALCVDVYVEVAGEWIKQGDTLYHTANSWKDSEINRCGFYVQLSSGMTRYFDDTEIWGPV